MQVVINIDDAVYKRAMVYKGEQFPDNDDLSGALITAVANGTPLPKGHGRLFDERDIVNGNYEIIGNRIYELEPIVEADRSEE